MTEGLTREEIKQRLEELNFKVIKVGKVRVLAEVDDRAILMVASDEISAFDVNLLPPIPDKGKILTVLSIQGLLFAEKLGVKTHLISADWKDMPVSDQIFHGRSILVRRTKPLLVECVVRGWLVGSGWRDYKDTGEVCGIKLPSGLQLASPLEPPLFTPATKAREGLHDENITFKRAAEILGRRTANIVRERTLMLYAAAALWAYQRGVALLDTKFEFGRRADGHLLLIDEVLTPDSSRFSPADKLQLGEQPISWDKEGLRQYLVQSGWNRKPPAPTLPPDIVNQTRQAYLEAFRQLLSSEFNE